MLNKIDLVPLEEVTRVRSAIEEMGFRVFAVSAATMEGIPDFKNALGQEVASLPPPELTDTEVVKTYRLEKKYDYTVTKKENLYSVDGPYIRELLMSTNFNDTNRSTIFRKINESGIHDALVEAGVQEGDDILLDGAALSLFCDILFFSALFLLNSSVYLCIVLVVLIEFFCFSLNCSY